jgi:hypothetical protein
MFGKNFEVFGYDEVTKAKRTIPVIAKSIEAAKEQLRKAMPSFVIVAIYPEVE